MAENKKSFVNYIDWGDTFDMLDDIDAGKLIKHFYAYVRDENPVLESKLLQIAFHPIKLQLKRDLVKYEEKKQQWSEAGKESAKQRALKKANVHIENPTDSTDVGFCSTDSTVNDTVNVNVNVNDTVINKEAKASMPSAPNYSEIIKNKGSICNHIRDYKPLSIEPYVDLWNLFATEKGLSTVQAINDTRRKKFKIRIREIPFDFIKILVKAKDSSFLKNRWFGFDWIIENDTNYLKVLEGNYVNESEGLKIEPLNNLNEQLKAASKTSSAA